MNKGTLYICGLLTVACLAYLLFLAAAWNQYQVDRTNRNEQIDALLERLPVKPAPSTEVTE